jgi:hypothetical protein
VGSERERQGSASEKNPSTTRPCAARAEKSQTAAHGPLAFIVLTAALSPYDLLKTEDFVLAVCTYSVAMLAALNTCALSNTLSHARAALTMPLYWPLASIAAWRAFLELLLRPHHWSKTAHGVSQRRHAPAPRTIALNQRRDASMLSIASTSPSL